MLHKSVVAFFDDKQQADRAMLELQKAGFHGDDVKSIDSGGFRAEREEQTGTGMLNLLRRLFGADYRMEAGPSSLYAEWLQKSGVLVAVRTDADHIAQATSILERLSGTEATTRVSRMETGERAVIVDRLRADTDRKMEVVEEELHVGKRRVERGAIRVIKRVTETPVEESINLRDEIVTIERRPLDRIANEADLRELAEARIEMIETAEEPVVSKEAHVKEEITIKRKVVDHVEKIRDKVRKTEIDIEGLEPGRLRDLEFRRDFTGRFASSGRDYSEYAPAYEFGSVLGSDERFRNREWTDIENEARKQWETKRQGSWKDFSDAVRHGWNTIRGRRAA